jgi:hypothetical protein
MKRIVKIQKVKEKRRTKKMTIFLMRMKKN